MDCICGTVRIGNFLKNFLGFFLFSIIAHKFCAASLPLCLISTWGKVSYPINISHTSNSSNDRFAWRSKVATTGIFFPNFSLILFTKKSSGSVIFSTTKAP